MLDGPPRRLSRWTHPGVKNDEDGALLIEPTLRDCPMAWRYTCRSGTPGTSRIEIRVWPKSMQTPSGRAESAMHTPG